MLYHLKSADRVRGVIEDCRQEIPGDAPAVWQADDVGRAAIYFAEQRQFAAARTTSRQFFNSVAVAVTYQREHLVQQIGYRQVAGFAVGHKVVVFVQYFQVTDGVEIMHLFLFALRGEPVTFTASVLTVYRAIEYSLHPASGSVGQRSGGRPYQAQ